MSERAARHRDYYALLGVRQGAAEDEIRRAFRALARRLHPDVNRAPDAAERFAAIVRAYETLGDAERRRAYDRDIQHAGRRAADPFGGPGPFAAHAASRAHTGEAGADGAAQSWGPYGMPAGRGRFDAPPPNQQASGDWGTRVPRRGALRGLDVHHTVHLSLEEAARGTVKTISVPRHEICILCAGTGAAPEGTARACPTCHGSGRARSGRDACLSCAGSGAVVDIACRGCGGSGRRQGIFELEGVRLPAGLPSVGYTRRIKGEGEPGPLGGPRGELLLHIQVKDGPTLRRVTAESADVRSDLFISADQARAGGRVDVPTVHGRVALRLPRDVASGATFTLRGKGLRRPARFGRGNHVVTIRVDMPPAG